MGTIATRNGKPAYLDAAPRQKSAVTMEEWLAGHETDAPPPASEFCPVRGTALIALSLGVVTLGIVAFS